MTIVTRWNLVKPALQVTIFAIEFQVDLAQPQACYLMFEASGIPVHVAGSTCGVEPGDLFPTGMTRSAVERFVKPVVRPSYRLVRKQGFFSGIVAVATLFSFMTLVAGLVVFLQRLPGYVILPHVMAAVTVLFLVAIDTLEIEALDVLFVMESDHGSLLIIRLIDLCIRFAHNGMWHAHYVRLVFHRRGQRPSGFLHVARVAVRVVAPLPMAQQALSVIRSFEARLTKVTLGRTRFMAFTARGMRLIRWRIVMAQRAAAFYGRHRGMELVGKCDRDVEV